MCCHSCPVPQSAELAALPTSSLALHQHASIAAYALKHAHPSAAQKSEAGMGTVNCVRLQPRVYSKNFLFNRFLFLKLYFSNWVIK
jgi:hypothetical protein